MLTHTISLADWLINYDVIIDGFFVYCIIIEQSERIISKLHHFLLNMKLLLRHTLECAFELNDPAKTTITASLYRTAVDSVYQSLIAQAASMKVLDCFILDCMSSLLSKGMYITILSLLFFHSRNSLYLLVIGEVNAGYHYGVQSEMDRPLETDKLDEDVAGLLGTPVRARLTSYPTHHFLDIYFC